MWRGGCIIRSVFLGKIKEAFDNNPNLTNLLLDPFFKSKIEEQEAIAGASARTLSNGYEYRNVDVEVHVDYEEKKYVATRLDTAEIIEDRNLKHNELQTEIIIEGE